MWDWEADVQPWTLSIRPQNYLQFKPVAYQHYLSIFKCVFGVSSGSCAQQQTPWGDRSGLLCGISLHGWSRASTWSHGWTVETEDMCNESKALRCRILGIFHQSRSSQCSSRTKAPLLSSLRPPPRQTSTVCPDTSLHILAIIPLSTSTPLWLTGLQITASTGTQHVRCEHTILPQ